MSPREPHEPENPAEPQLPNIIFSVLFAMHVMSPNATVPRNQANES